MVSTRTARTAVSVRVITPAASRRRQAFTLIELLVVIAIISILASILFPAFASARERARQTSCLSNTKQLNTAFQMYTQDFDESFPDAGGHGAIGVCGGTVDNGWVRKELIDQTVAKTCTSAQLPVPNGALYTYIKNTRVYVCPSDTQGDDRTLSYGMNSSVGNQALAYVREPSNCILLLDEQTGHVDDGYFQAPLLNLASGSANFGPANDIPATRHLDGGNVAFVDGHSKWLKATQLKAENFSPVFNQ